MFLVVFMTTLLCGVIKKRNRHLTLFHIGVLEVPSPSSSAGHDSLEKTYIILDIIGLYVLVKLLTSFTTHTHFRRDIVSLLGFLCKSFPF